MGRSATNTKQKLIDTASELIWKNSYGSVSVDDICKAADVKKGSFYHYFKSKAELAVAVMDNCYDQSKPMFDEVFSPTRPACERFLKLADVVLEEQEKALEQYGFVCGCPCASLGSEMAMQEDLIREKVNKIFETYDKYYEQAIRDLIAEGLIEDGIDVKARAVKVRGFGMGQAAIARMENSLEPFKRDLKIGWLRILGIDEKKYDL